MLLVPDAGPVLAAESSQPWICATEGSFPNEGFGRGEAPGGLPLCCRTSRPKALVRVRHCLEACDRVGSEQGRPALGELDSENAAAAGSSPKWEKMRVIVFF